MCFAPQRRALFRHFFGIWTSKSGPRPSVFNTFDLEMCFAPQQRALFQHLNFQKWSGAEVFCTWKCASRHNGVHFFDIHNFQKWSGPGVFCTFWLGNVLRATTACTFSTSQLPKVVRPWCVLYILTWKSASRHNGVQFFISRLASWLRTRRFSEPTFRPSGATNHWKNTVFRDFPTFSRICSVCPLTLSLLIFSLLIFLFSVPLPCSAFHLSILSEVWLLNFLRLCNMIKSIYKCEHVIVSVQVQKPFTRWLEWNSCLQRCNSSPSNVAMKVRHCCSKQSKQLYLQVDIGLRDIKSNYSVALLRVRHKLHEIVVPCWAL